MGIYFESLLKTSAICGAAILLIMLISPILKKRDTAFWRYLLWIALSIRLLLPFDISVPNPVVTLAPMSGTSGQNTVRETAISNADETAKPEAPAQTAKPEAPAQTAKPEASAFSNSNPPEASAHSATPDSDTQTDSRQFPAADAGSGNPASASPRESRQSLPFQDKLFFIWAAVTALLSLAQVAGYWNFCRKINKTKSYLFQQEEVPVFASPVVRSPMLAGICKPQILLPPQKYGQEQLQFILSHELGHYRRKDLLAKLLLAVARTLHWFNPLAWYMERRAAQDMELLCDIRVVRGFPKEKKKRYGEMLLSLAESNCRAGVLCVSGPAKKTRTLKERLSNIISSEKRKKGLLPAFVGIGLIMCASLFIAFGYSNAPSKTQQNQTALPETQQSRAALPETQQSRTALPESQQSQADSSTADAQITGTQLSGLPELAIEKAATAKYKDGFPQLIYASSKRAILYGHWGIMVYDIEKEKIAQLLDISAAGIETGIEAGSKDRTIHIEASRDGKQILLYQKPDTGKKYLYHIDEKKLEYTDLTKLKENKYDSFLSFKETRYALTEDGKTAYLTNNCLMQKGGTGRIFHKKDMAGLALVISDRSKGEAEAFALFREYYEAKGETAFPRYLHKDLERRVISEEFLYEDSSGWRYYLKEDTKKESPIQEFAKVLGPLLLVREKDGKRQVLEDLMVQYMQANCPVLFADGRIIYQAAATADMSSVKDPVMVSIAMDGSDRKTADNILYHCFKNMCEDQGWIYYAGWTNDGAFPQPLCRIPADFSTGPQLVDNLPGLLCGVLDGHAFYLADDSQEPGVYCRDLKTGKEELYEKWGVSANEITPFNSRMISVKAPGTKKGTVPGCHILFSYEWDEERYATDIPFDLHSRVL